MRGSNNGNIRCLSSINALRISRIPSTSRISFTECRCWWQTSCSSSCRSNTSALSSMSEPGTWRVHTQLIVRHNSVYATCHVKIWVKKTWSHTLNTTSSTHFQTNTRSVLQVSLNAYKHNVALSPFAKEAQVHTVMLHHLQSAWRFISSLHAYIIARRKSVRP